MIKEKLIIWVLKGMSKDTFRRRIVLGLANRKLNKLMEAYNMKSWKTTTVGVAAILSALGGIADGFASGDMGVVRGSITGLIAGIGLLMARDNDKSSEQVGVK